MNRIGSALLVLALSVGAIATTGSIELGCTAAQWANFVTLATQFATYVLTFLTGAKGAWALILPLLGTDAPAADKAFQKALVTAADAVAALQDAIKVATLAQQPSPDLIALMDAVKDAISNVMVIVNQYRAQAMQVGVSYDALNAHARAIAAWQTR